MPQSQKKSSSFGWIVTACVVAVALIMAAITLNALENKERDANTAVPALSAGMAQPIVLGNPDAPNTMTLFEDYQCPGCKGFEDYFGNIKYDALAKDLVKVEYYPVAFLTEGSSLASNAAACAADQGKFNEYHQALFTHQPSERDGVSFTQDLLLMLGESIQFEDPREFQRCVTSNRYATWVESLLSVLDERQIQGTPAVFINGKQFDFVNSSELDLAVLLGLAEPRPTESASPEAANN